MTAIALKIVKPPHDKVFTSTQVELQGSAEVPPEAAGAALYHRWYSDLHPATKQDAYGLDPPGALRDPAQAVTRTLAIGTHVLSLAVTDQEQQTKDALEKVVHGGLAGGPAQAPRPCVVTVLRAVLDAPAIQPPGRCVLDVQGPLLWTEKRYHDRNRLRYRFTFTPDRADGRPTVQLAPLPPTFKAAAGDPPTFVYDGELQPVDQQPGTLRYDGPLPAGIESGAYAVVLRVDDLRDPTTFDESDPKPVVIAL